MSMVAKVPLTKGKFAIVDDDDLPRVLEKKWRACWSKTTKSYRAMAHVIDDEGKDRSVFMHRFILSPDRGDVIDHINHDTLDNRRCNLRVCSQSENLQNARRRCNSTSGYKGVSWDKTRGQWRSYITHNGKFLFLGRFDMVRDAAKAYDRAAVEFFGDYAYLNFKQ